MCGIVAILDPGRPAQARRELAEAVVGRMAHRGPDGRGYYDAGPVSLGMCRLSITDVAGGMQPLYSEDRRVVLVCNGEIYNHQSLRAGLVSRGHAFRTGSDCEVIVHLYEEMGEALLGELCGMFAFAMWDEAAGTLLCARDRTGMKPLYCARDGARLVLASEFGALAGALGLRPDIDPERALEFLLYGYPVHHVLTVDRAVRRLPPASAMRATVDGLTVRTYWRPAYCDPAAGRVPGQTQGLRQVFLAGLGEHLISEVPSALMLSGGLDSTSVAAYAGELGYRMLAISAGYVGDHDCDESGLAEETAMKLGFSFRRALLDPARGMEAFEELMGHCDEPVADIASVPQWAIFKSLREMGVTVLHSGLGGDEIFYGYDFWNGLSGELMREGRGRGLPPDWGSGFLRHPAVAAALRELSETLRPGVWDMVRGLDDQVAARYGLGELAPPDSVYHLLFSTWLPNNCLHLGDRLSMAHGLELRLPLLDDRLVGFIQGLDPGQRFDPGRGKPLLKGLLAEVLPQEAIDRLKRGFTPPGDLMREIVLRCREEIASGWLSRNLMEAGALAGALEACRTPDFLFRMAVFEKWLARAYPAG